VLAAETATLIIFVRILASEVRAPVIVDSDNSSWAATFAHHPNEAGSEKKKESSVLSKADDNAGWRACEKLENENYTY
jgi:hypothetical protein